MRAVNGSRESR